jgi:paraquat-inducible protein A
MSGAKYILRLALPRELSFHGELTSPSPVAPAAPSFLRLLAASTKPATMNSSLPNRYRATPPARLLTCRLCGREHHLAALQRGERALCDRCGGLLAKRSWFGRDAALAFTLTAFILAIPAVSLPIVSVDKLRSERIGYLVTGVEALWLDGMKLLSIWVLLCGVIAPLLLLGVLTGLLLPPKLGLPVAARATLWRAAYALEHWSMPEVYILAMLVALTKLGTLVNVTVETGFWCYGAATIMALAAWRSFEFGVPHVLGERAAPSAA